MADSYVNILYIADIVGNPGISAVRENLNRIRGKFDIHMTIANGENRTSGKGLSMRDAEELFDLGIGVITSGNHIWNRKDHEKLLEHDHRVLRPYNYPPNCLGRGICTIPVKESVLGVLNLQGRSFMYPIDCPFRGADSAITALKRLGAHFIIVDFHAEATAEKIALGWYLDGQVSGVVGSHTHVQTADERILPAGTAYITDAGMTGPFNSVIGMKKEVAIDRFINQVPAYYQMAEHDNHFCGVVIKISKQTGMAVSIERVQDSCSG